MRVSQRATVQLGPQCRCSIGLETAMSLQSAREVRAIVRHQWKEYVRISPQAGRIHSLLEARGEVIRNDHIAFRTFAGVELGVDVIARPFIERGYEYTGEYRFEEKRLFARSFSHSDPTLPRVFISELLVEEFSPRFRKIVASILASVDRSIDPLELLERQQVWPQISLADYDSLLRESEYGAWLAAFGLRANHFTVSVNELRSFAGLSALNRFLEGRGFNFNGRDGKKIMGSPAQLLEQSSTLADVIRWEFADGTRAIPSCYYEFALRHRDPRTGRPYDGFVAASADRIFESTDVSNRLDA